jgi:glucosamine 6-phosphate synthetase-like amidotransferase/phosphosugar isomerase protein
MCRNFNVFLSPVKIEHLFFSKNPETGKYTRRNIAELKAILRDRRLYATAVAEDCSKKSTKAGYDAAGMAIGTIPLDPIFDLLSQSGTENGGLSAEEAVQWSEKIAREIQMQVKLSRDGGDLLKTWDALVERTGLNDSEFLTNWETHVRQASQGDMYSESNAHPHCEVLTRQKVRFYQLTPEGVVAVTERPHTGQTSLFWDTHNGDINDASRYKRFLTDEGFRFTSNSDSCVEPALKRFLYEHLEADSLPGALYRLAYTDPDYLTQQTAVIDSSGHIGGYAVGTEFAYQTLTVKIKGDRITFYHEGQVVKSFTQQGFLRDDERSQASEKIQELLNLAQVMAKANAQNATIAAALVARVLEYSNPKNKFAFQSYTPLGKPQSGCIGGGTYTMVRGGTERGGEEGGEIIFYIPKSYDLRNYNKAAFLSASEENALKEQVILLDPAALAENKFDLAHKVAREVNFLTDLKATAYITEGVAPIYDVLPGELVEVTADGQARLFNIYRGEEIPLIPIEHQEKTHHPSHYVRYERLAPLKVFQIQYRDLNGTPIPCPYNKYGEEIIAIQPLALRKNTEKLFDIRPDGKVTLRTGETGIGLMMGTQDETLRRERIKNLTQIITGAAGTSFLINAIAGNLARKLGLNTLPVMNLDGFTGSDTLPPSVGANTLFIANSNSGGTSDTIKLTHELASLPSVVARVEAEVQRRDRNLADVIVAQARLDEIHTLLQPDTQRLDLPPHLQDFIAEKTPWIYVVTNIEASALGNIGRGLDAAIQPAAGAGITNLPEEECVGSTFAAMASLQWQLTLHTYIGEVRGDISPEYASQIYGELARLPDVAAQIVSDKTLIGEIKRMAAELVGGNFDFVYTGYLDGVPEEQAHKAAEMIQEMFAGWHFFQFQHGKYAHMKRRTRHTLGSILGHNVPPPSWPFFNARAIKSASEIGPRVATSFFIAHESDKERLQAIPDYAPDFIFTYPADSITLYPFQVIIVSHLISYFWGLKKKEIAKQIEAWNQPFIDILMQVNATDTELSEPLRRQAEQHAQSVLSEFLHRCETTHHFDRIEGTRKKAITNGLYLLAGATEQHYTYHAGGFLQSPEQAINVAETRQAAQSIDNCTYLSILKDIALELSNNEQAKQLGDRFLVDESGITILNQINVPRPAARSRAVYECDYLIEYEGLGTFYDVEPVHPPKIAKAKKGWL